MAAAANKRLIALVREVPSTFHKALSSAPGAGTIDVALAKQQWQGYVSALRKLVDTVHVIPADDAYPDCPFIEDTVVCARGTAVLTRPGHPSRMGEVQAVGDWFKTAEEYAEGALQLQTLAELDAEATLDGGDVLYTGRHMFVGLSKRTNAAAARCLQRAFGPSLPVVPINIQDLDGVLHLKCLVTGLGPGALCVVDSPAGRQVGERMAGAVDGVAYTSVAVPDEFAANVVSIHSDTWRGALVQGNRCRDSVNLLRSAFASSASSSSSLQGAVHELDMSEFIKADGSLTCLSVILEVPAR
ncbi:hypothetical protein JKP88DRAFT_196497 [Tribonema minus]|uniref:Dimethylargininase n=1 Tax=Tribonema minus TaxID=303371 RepID=A0A835YN07_9STRA|nr:hypothetical protein JKP88DRAFT_196497 [Tribonema minus]